MISLTLDQMIALFLGVVGLLMALFATIGAVLDWRSLRHGAREECMVAAGIARRQVYVLLIQVVLCFRAFVVVTMGYLVGAEDGWRLVVRWTIPLVSLLGILLSGSYLMTKRNLDRQDAQSARDQR